MTSLLLMVIVLMQGPGRLQPGSGIVTGSVQVEGGGSAAGVRVGAMAVDDPTATDLLSVTQTDASGRYRLVNIPAGRYFIVAGRLDNLSYFPGGTDRTRAAEVVVEAAKIKSIESFTVSAGSKRPPSPVFQPRPGDQEYIAFGRIALQRNAEARKKLLLTFEKDFPRSTRLAEIYVELSRTLASQSDFTNANQYAEKAVAAVARMKSEASSSPTYDRTWHNWLVSLDVSARSNLSWVKQMLAWQQDQLHAAVLRKR